MALSRGRESPKSKEEIGVSLSTQLKDHAGRKGGGGGGGGGRRGVGNFRFRENSVGKGGGGADSLIFGGSSYCNSGFDKCSRTPLTGKLVFAKRISGFSEFLLKAEK